MACQQKQGCDDGKKATEPGEAGAEPIQKLLWSVDVGQGLDKSVRVLQLVVDLGAKHPSEGGPQDDVVGNVGKAAPAGVSPQDEIRGHECQPHKDAESA